MASYYLSSGTSTFNCSNNWPMLDIYMSVLTIETAGLSEYRFITCL